MAGSLCGVWIDEAGRGHTTVETGTRGPGGRGADLRPFAWLNAAPLPPLGPEFSIAELKEQGPYNRLLHADTTTAFNAFSRGERNGVSVDVIRPFESQFLLQQRERMYREMTF